MRSLSSILAGLSLLVPSTLAADKIVLKDLQNHAFAVDCPSGSSLRLRLRSGDIRIIGRDSNKISVRLEGRNADQAGDLTVRFERFANDADLRISGGPKNDLQIIVEIPASSSLFVRMPAGDLTIEGVTGNKDVELHAGDLSISVGNPADYAHVRASVNAGDIEAGPFHESHGGLFRSFEKSGPGQYKLHAHVGAGDLTLR
jgi:hypothetical protein